MILNVAFVVLGLILLTAGGDLLVRSALSLAEKIGISPLLCGLVIVGFGTSAPELAVSLDAGLHGLPDIALGNVIGSNISNVLLVLGLCAVIAPLPVQKLVLSRDAVAVVAMSVLLYLMVALQPGDAVFGRAFGMVLLLLFALYLAYAVHSEREAMLWEKIPEEIGSSAISKGSRLRDALLVFAGLAILIASSRMLVHGAVGIATALGVSQALIGLTLVAVGTSLPEMVVSVLATLRGHSAVAVGNILGSNLFNALGILGITATLQPLAVAPRFASYDLAAMLFSAVLLMVCLLTGSRVSRPEGAVLLASYAAYICIGHLIYGIQAA